MTEKKELKDKQLEKVSGGSTEENAPETVPYGNGFFNGFISKYAESHIGELLYLVSHDGKNYYYGTLTDSFEAETTFYTERTQVMSCVEHNDKKLSGVVEVSGDDYWLYRERISYKVL